MTNEATALDRARCLGAIAAEVPNDRAGRASRGGPLADWDVAVKDNIAVGDVEMTAGSLILEGFIPLDDATVVSRLRRAGARIVAKTRLDEFGMGGTGRLDARGAVSHPWLAGRLPGGSSSGSAVIVAVGACRAALGSDTGGSVRLPAAWCGLVGFRPSWGTVSRAGLVAFASSMDVIGPIARNVSDAREIFEVVSGPDARDMTTVAHFESTRTSAPTLLYPPPSDLAGVWAPGRRALDQAVARVRELGISTAETACAPEPGAIEAYYVLSSVEAASNLARYDGIHFGPSERGATTKEVTRRTRTRRFGPEVRRRVLSGVFASRAGAMDDYLCRAEGARQRIRERLSRLLDDGRIVIWPAAPTGPVESSASFGDPLVEVRCDRWLCPAALGGVPSIVLPWGRTPAGEPVAVQLLAGRLRDHELMEFAEILEHARGPLREIDDFDPYPVSRWEAGPAPTLHGAASEHTGRGMPPEVEGWSDLHYPSDGDVRIGLEVHVQLALEERLFSRSPVADPDAPTAPSSRSGPYDAGHPGELPVLNPGALTLARAAACAFGSVECDVVRFDRKHYTYPDLPKGYQITQKRTPFASGGTVSGPGMRPVRLIGIHLEEDSARTIALDHGRLEIDLDRAGVALLEVVTAPTITSADDASKTMKRVRDVLVAAGVTHGELELGELRCDGNLSVRERGRWSPRVEIKNVNSYEHLRLALESEIKRLRAELAGGGALRAQTRAFDAAKAECLHLRYKEETPDYRFLPEPDVPEVRLPGRPPVRPPSTPEELRCGLEQAGWSSRTAIRVAESLRLIRWVRRYDERYAPALGRLLLGPLGRSLNSGTATLDRSGRIWTGGVCVEEGAVVEWLDASLGGAAAHDTREAWRELMRSGVRPVVTLSRIAESRLSPGEVAKLIDRVIALHEEECARFQHGEQAVLGFLVGAAMRDVAGRADGKTVRATLIDRLQKTDDS